MTYIDRKDTSKGNATSDKNRIAGPQRAKTSIRTTSRFDYAHDLCKDYNETGFCGFGDSCKFIHDRGDYKSGWELDEDWEATKGHLEKERDTFTIDKEEKITETKAIPEICGICTEKFTRPVVVTKCGHFFCEKCALKKTKTSSKCHICLSPVNGQFQIAKDFMKKFP